MKEQFKRDFNKTYLILCNEELQPEESYETQMLMSNSLERILPLQIQRVNGEIQMFYDVTAKQPLRDCAERAKLSFQTLYDLFCAVDNALKEIKDYLLDAESVVLDLEHIYIREGTFYFCYYPWEKQDILCSFRKLLEEILGCLDYRDTAGVELAYHLYQSVCRGEFQISQILKEHLKLHEEVHDAEKEWTGNDLSMEEIWKDMEVREERAAYEPQKKKSLFERILKFFMKKEVEEASEVFNDRSEIIKEPEYRYETVKESPPLWEESDGNTTLLKNMPCGTWRLRPLLPGYQEFCITGKNFVVGKKKDAVDGYIGRGSISRIHSRFSVRENRLYIADANSTNGTFVNDIALAPGKEVEIFQGDRILFADVGYECYNNL